MVSALRGMDYDLSSEPVRYFEAQVARFAEVQRRLMTTLAPGEAYERYGHAVELILGSYVPELGFNAIGYLGGQVPLEL